MTLNLDAFKAHVNITISLNDSLARSATFLETLCFHIVDDAMIGGTSVTTSIFTPSNPEITLDDTAILPSDTAYQKMDAFMATFLNGGGKSAMFLITTSTLEVSYAFQRELDYKALSIASEVDISKFEETMTDKVLLFPTMDKAYVNTLKKSYVFYVIEAMDDFMNFLTMLFSRTGDAFFNRKILFTSMKMTNPRDALVYEEDILALHANKVSSFELIYTPDTGRVSNFATSRDNGMGIYQRYRVKLECERALDALMQRDTFMYNARSMSEGTNGYVGGQQNCLLAIYSNLHLVLNTYVQRGIIQSRYYINVPDQTIEDMEREYIVGIVVSFNPLRVPFRLQVNFTDFVDVTTVAINGVAQGRQAVFSKGVLLR